MSLPCKLVCEYTSVATRDRSRAPRATIRDSRARLRAEAAPARPSLSINTATGRALARRVRDSRVFRLVAQPSSPSRRARSVADQRRLGSVGPETAPCANHRASRRPHTGRRYRAQRAHAFYYRLQPYRSLPKPHRHGQARGPCSTMAAWTSHYPYFRNRGSAVLEAPFRRRRFLGTLVRPVPHAGPTLDKVAQGSAARSSS
jgi:hypothetical protein